MSMTQTQTQGISPDDLRVQAFMVLDTLNEEQLLEVVAYARCLQSEPVHVRENALESLIEIDLDGEE
jgi:hypothetical protein